jgi:hypothetical protein
VASFGEERSWAPARSPGATFFAGVTDLVVLTGMDFGLGGSSAFAAAEAITSNMPSV